MKRIIVKYSGDFRRSKVFTEAYEILMDKGFGITLAINRYSAGPRVGEAEYIFRDGTILPDEAKLEEMLKGLNFHGLNVIDSEGIAQ